MIRAEKATAHRTVLGRSVLGGHSRICEECSTRFTDPPLGAQSLAGMAVVAGGWGALTVLAAPGGGIAMGCWVTVGSLPL